MIKFVRFAYTGMSGLLLALTLIRLPSILFSVFAGVLTLIWMLSPRLKTFIHLAVLPVLSGGVILASLFGSNPYGQILLFVLILTAWEIDGLYLDSMEYLEKKAERILLRPLLIHQILSSAGLTALYALTENKGLRIGFWPLMVITLSLIAVLRRLFSSEKE